MSGCKCENWTLQDLSSALQDMNKDNKRIVVPMFQRGKRWKREQEEKFIDSLIKGYPVGTMLFYETDESGTRTYILVDGLQRGNSIKKYMTNPTEFFYDETISDEFCARVLGLFDKSGATELYPEIRTLLTQFIKAQKTFKNLQFYTISKKISDKLLGGDDHIEELINTIKDFFEERQDLYDKIANTVIPVIVYTGDESNLPDIFDRINSQGTALDQYEVYAAAWPVDKKFQINNSDIVEHIVRKYDAFTEDGFKIHGYSREEMRSSKKVNAFEYLFGLGKHLVKKYDMLSFNANYAEDTVNPIAFELVNACLNDANKIKKLYVNLYAIDVNSFEKALYTAIEFVQAAIQTITNFKGNSRKDKKGFHAKYQILSMIATTFKEMYDGDDFAHLSDSWSAKKDMIRNNLAQYYVYDIITNYWSEGGIGKLANKTNRYAIDISSRAWMVALDAFFEKSMQRVENKKIASPRNEEYVFLNCIYLEAFTAKDQLSLKRFDVEHIAPKEQMKKLIKDCSVEKDGLPISCIANLCYLPEQVNRSKKDKNFYQDQKYLNHIDLAEVETKYSFTEKEDLEWMDVPYENPEDFKVLKEYYVEYCTKRFDKMKHLFCDALGIEYTDITEPETEPAVVEPEPQPTTTAQVTVTPKPNTKSADNNAEFLKRCVQRLANEKGLDLLKVKQNTYTTADKKKGFIFVTSKLYMQGKYEKYWFSYRKELLQHIADCKEKYIIYGCKNESTMLCIPIEDMENNLDRLRTSINQDDGKILRWHVVFLKDTNGRIVILVSKPKVEKIEVNKYLL